MTETELKTEKKIKKKSLWDKYFTPVFLILLLGFLVYTGKINVLVDKAKSMMGEGKGTVVNNFAFEEIKSGQTVNFSDYKGKVVIVNFWATWCPPCKFEIPAFNELHNEFKDRAVIVGISVDEEGKQAVNEYLKTQNIDYPLGMVSPEIAANFGEIIALPTTFVINRDGVVEKKMSGYHIKSSFKSAIEKLL